MAATKKKTARRTAKKKTSAGKASAGKAAPRKATGGAAKEVPVKTAGRETSLEDRLLAPIGEIERLLDRLRRTDWLRPLGMEWPRWPDIQHALDFRAPSMDVVNRPKEIFVRAEVPGIDKEDLEVTVTDRSLTIAGTSRHEEESAEGDVHRHEIRSGSFSRTVTLPEDVDGRRAKASYKDGIVELHLPKLRSAKKHSVKLD